MAAASHEDGGGYGKFRRRPFRRPQTTPYDRPSTSIRNLNTNNNNRTNSNGWLSKIVDPAQRLITYSAHKLFSSVFRKRLPPPHPPEPEANGGVINTQPNGDPKYLPRRPESEGSDVEYPDSSSGRDGLAEVELILKQKKFTRFEIDRLTALLQTRDVDRPSRPEDEECDVYPLKGALSDGRKKEFSITPIKDDGLNSHHISNPIVSPTVLDEDVASPAELAKAYMGSRPSKISPSALGLRGLREERTITQTDQPFSVSLPIMSAVARSSNHSMPYENPFVTPRARGRSAIYNMARTPYSRVHSTSSVQGAGIEDAFGAPSTLSRRILESSKYSESKQGSLKRRSSVLDSDIGRVGPIRRIRQKSNLLASSGILSSNGTGLGSDPVDHPSSSHKNILSGEPSIGNEGNNIHGSGISSIPSKSTEIASKILQQLDMLVSSRGKSPTKLSPSMLRGPALRSLENVDSSKFLETIKDNNKMDAKYDGSLPDERKSASQKQDGVNENCLVKLSGLNDKTLASNGVNPPTSVNFNGSQVKALSFNMSSLVQSPSQKKHAFQMSAHEDSLELDDDIHSDKAASDVLAGEKERLHLNLAEDKTASALATIMEKPSQAEPHASSILSEPSSAFADNASPLAVVTMQQPTEDKEASVRPDDPSSLKESNAAPAFSILVNKAACPKEPNGFTSSNLNSKSGDSIPQSTFDSISPIVASSSPTIMNSTSFTSCISSDPKTDSSSSFAFGAVDATKSLTTGAESNKGADMNNSKAGVFCSTEPATSVVSMPPPSAGMFSFGLPGASSVNSPFSSSTPAIVSQSGSSSSSAASTSCNTVPALFGSTPMKSEISNLSLPSSVPSFLSPPASKFFPPNVQSTSSSSVSTTIGVESTEAKENQPGLGNLTSVSSGSASSALSSTEMSTSNGISAAIVNGSTSTAMTNVGSSIFNFNAGASASAATTNQSRPFNPFSASSSQPSVAGTLFSTSTRSTPIQFGSTVSSPFGLTSKEGFSSGGSSFGSSSSTGNLLNAGATFGLASSTSESKPVSSTIPTPAFGSNASFSSTLESKSISTTTTTPVFGSGATFGLASSPLESKSGISTSTTSVFGSNWSAAKSPAFGSAFNSSSASAGFVFGGASISDASGSTTMKFGSSPSAASGSVFNFGATPSATQLHPGFGNRSSPTFGSTASGNDQMNMEDSMAEDTVQAASTVPVFGQQSITPSSATGTVFGQQSVTPTSSGFVFGSTMPTPQLSNPFPFASQPNLAAPQNQSPFQATGSLEFNAGGNFSLGSGGVDKSNRKFVKIRKNQRKK